MKTAIERVKAFHLATGLKVAEYPNIPRINVTDLRIKLIEEEYKELYEAMMVDNLEETADAMCDLIYVIIGGALEYGLPLDELFTEVCDNNDTKWINGVRRREDGKILKPEGWKPPRIREIIEKAINQSPDTNN